MRPIYLVLTYTGTLLSKIIKCYTKDEFSHVSIALDADLKEMYSFGRLRPYNPFIGSFVHEGINIGTFKRFRKTTSEVYSLYVSDEQYEKIYKTIEYFNVNKEKYSFNVLGLICVSIKKKVKRKNRFYCAEFVKHVLKVAGITEAKKLPELVKPQDFKELEHLRLEYKGLLRKYRKKKYLKLNGVQNLLNEKQISYV